MADNKTLTKTFQELSKGDVKIAGGKGASLGEMTQFKIPVPPGFVVLSTAFELFLEKNNLKANIDAILHDVGYSKIHAIENASEKIRAIILSANIPNKIANEILSSFEKLNIKFVAVRSSATVEDSSVAAWAGQLESYLNTTKKDLLENVKKCWASLFLPRAIVYRFEKNLHKHPISVAVVIQKMIESDVAGVAFSAHPVTQERNRIVIDANLGLGEAVVSGQFNPDSYLIEKRSGKIISITRSSQTKKLVRKNAGGNTWVTVDTPKMQKLSEIQILELSKIIKKIEKMSGLPVDIEWAFKDRQFYILQSRPITVISNKNGKEEQKFSYGNQKLFERAYSREFSLFQCSAWSKSDWSDLKRLLGINVRSLFLRKQGRIVVYQNPEEIKKMERIIAKLYLKGMPAFLKIKEDCYKHYIPLLAFVKNERRILNMNDLKEFYDLLVNGWAAYSIIQTTPDIPGVSDEIKNAATNIREISQDYTDDIDRLFFTYLNKQFPAYAHLAQVLLPEEIFSLENSKFTKESLNAFEKRLSGCLLLNGEIFSLKQAESKLREQHIALFEPTQNQNEFVRGICACRGQVQSIARIVLNKQDLHKVNKGDVLITPMTTPDFLPALIQASAFVTDEGGIICHAAIIARELRKPCVIGTKFATHIFKNDDIIEVDATNGIVRLVERKGKPKQINIKL